MSVQTPEVSFDTRFFDSLSELSAAESQRVTEAIAKFLKAPTSPGLNLEALKGDSSLMSIRASRSIRVILHRRGSTFVVLFAAQHDEAYDRIARGKFFINPHARRMGFVASDVQFAPAEPRSIRSNVSAGPAPFDHWTTSELVASGLTLQEAAALRDLVDEEGLVSLIDAGWSDDRVDFAIELLELTFEDWKRQKETANVEDANEKRLRSAIRDFGALAGLSQLLGVEEAERLAAAPIEEWMLFLHPDQHSIVDRVFLGPARVRGGAGTGKTVVLLHRAAALSKRIGKHEQILVTTYINSLPPILERLFVRLPNAIPDRVEFMNVHRLAFKICHDAGEPQRVETRDVNASFAIAWRSVVTQGSSIDRASLSPAYMREEIETVIKGRSIIEFNDYLQLSRVGRRTQFNGPVRRQTWELMLAWNNEMSARGVVTFNDVVSKAKFIADTKEIPTYRAILVDEAQDLTLTGLQLLRSLVNGQGVDVSDGLFITGDGAQRIYPGGFTLRQAGIEVRGRTAVLRHNYRNTDEIYDTAVSIGGNDEIEDLDEQFRRSEAPAELDRHGARVELLQTSSSSEQSDALGRRLQDLVNRDTSVNFGDIAVLYPTNHQAEQARNDLKVRGIPVQDLKEYEGRTNEFVKVGTYHRAKGLEFKVVFLPSLSSGEFPRPKAEGRVDREYEDQRNLEVSALFVAMTRARDRLILASVGRPSEVLQPVLNRLEIHGA